MLREIDTYETLPSYPTDWLDYGPLVFDDGLLPHCTVLRHLTGKNLFTPYVVHTAILIKGKWDYVSGTYFKENCLLDAREFFHRVMIQPSV